MDSSIVSFRKAVVDDTVPEKDRKFIDAVEIRYSDARVVVLPATDVNAESGERYCDLYADKYKAFKDGKPDPDRVAQLEAEIDSKKKELAAVKSGDDWRVQDNLGYREKPTADETDPVPITVTKTSDKKKHA